MLRGAALPSLKSSTSASRRLDSEVLMEQGRLLLAGSILVALGVPICWWIVRAPPTPVGDVDLSAKPSKEATERSSAAIPQALDPAADAIAPSSEPSSPDLRAPLPTDDPADFETKYRYATWKELDERAGQLWEAVIRAAGEEGNRLRREGLYARLTVEEVAARQDPQLESDDRRRFTTEF